MQSKYRRGQDMRGGRRAYFRLLLMCFLRAVRERCNGASRIQTANWHRNDAPNTWTALLDGRTWGTMHTMLQGGLEESRNAVCVHSSLESRGEGAGKGRGVRDAAAARGDVHVGSEDTKGCAVNAVNDT